MEGRVAPLPAGAEEYVRDSIHSSLGLPVSDRSLRLKLLASEEQRHRLQDHIFSLEEDLRAAQRRIDLLKVRIAFLDSFVPSFVFLPRPSRPWHLSGFTHSFAFLPQAEAAMNAAGLRRCVEDKEALATAYAQLNAKCAKECDLYERDLERAMDSCDELARENNDLRARLHQNANVCVCATNITFLYSTCCTLSASFVSIDTRKVTSTY